MGFELLERVYVGRQEECVSLCKLLRNSVFTFLRGIYADSTQFWERKY